MSDARATSRADIAGRSRHGHPSMDPLRIAELPHRPDGDLVAVADRDEVTATAHASKRHSSGPAAEALRVRDGRTADCAPPELDHQVILALRHLGIQLHGQIDG